VEFSVDKSWNKISKKKKESTRKLQEHPGVSFHGDQASDEAGIADCSLQDSEPLRPWILVLMTELGERKEIK